MCVCDFQSGMATCVGCELWIYHWPVKQCPASRDAAESASASSLVSVSTHSHKCKNIHKNPVEDMLAYGNALFDTQVHSLKNFFFPPNPPNKSWTLVSNKTVCLLKKKLCKQRFRNLCLTDSLLDYIGFNDKLKWSECAPPVHTYQINYPS